MQLWLLCCQPVDIDDEEGDVFTQSFQTQFAVAIDVCFADFDEASLRPAHLAAVGYDPDMGARPLNRVMTKEIENRLAEYLLGQRVTDGGVVKVDVSINRQTKAKEFTFAIVEKVVRRPAPQAEERAVA